jgi:hypothetical protein
MAKRKRCGQGIVRHITALATRLRDLPDEVGLRVRSLRERDRERKGWSTDTYLLRRSDS